MGDKKLVSNKFREIRICDPCSFCDRKINYFSCNRCFHAVDIHENTPPEKCKFCNQMDLCSLCSSGAYSACLCCDKIICVSHATPINENMSADYLSKMTPKGFTFYVACKDCVEFKAPDRRAKGVIQEYKKLRTPQIRIILRMLFAQKNMFDNKFVVSFSNLLFKYVHLM